MRAGPETWNRRDVLALGVAGGSALQAGGSSSPGGAPGERRGFRTAICDPSRFYLDANLLLQRGGVVPAGSRHHRTDADPQRFGFVQRNRGGPSVANNYLGPLDGRVMLDRRSSPPGVEVAERD
jgi:hypothetical protein